MLPAVPLFLLLQDHNLNWMQLLPWGAAISAALTMANVKVLAGSVSKRLMVSLFVAHSLYGYAVAEAINTRFDRSPGVVYQAHVIEKQRRKRIPSRNSYYYSLTLSPWGPHSDINTVNASEWLGEYVDPGSEICITLSPGTLRVSWFTADLCTR